MGVNLGSGVTLSGGGIFDASTGLYLTVYRLAIAAATSGNNTLLAGQSGQKIRVLSMALVAGAAGNIYFTSATSSVIFGGSTNKIGLAANGGFVLPRNVDGWMETVAGEALTMNADSTGPFAGGFTYVLI